MRIFAGAMALLMVFSLGVEIYSYIQSNRKAQLSAQAQDLLGKSSSVYAAKLTFSATNNAYMYNEGYTAQGSDSATSVSGPRFSASFAGNNDKTVSVTDVVNNITITMTPKFALGDPYQDVNRVIYPIKGMDAAKVYTLRAGSVKEDIIFNKYIRDSISFSYDLGLPAGTEARMEPNGSIGIYGTDSKLLGNVTTATEADAKLLDQARQNGKKTQLLFTIPAPVILDSSHKANKGTAKYELKDKVLTVSAASLKDLSYPVSLDPSVYIETAAQLMRGNNETNVDFDVANELIQKARQLVRVSMHGRVLPI